MTRYLIAEDEPCCRTWTRIRDGRLEEQHEPTCPRFPARNAWDRCAGRREADCA